MSMSKNVLRDAKKALKAILELYSEDTPPVKAQERVIEFIEHQLNVKTETKGK